MYRIKKHMKVCVSQCSVFLCFTRFKVLFCYHGVTQDTHKYSLLLLLLLHMYIYGHHITCVCLCVCVCATDVCMCFDVVCEEYRIKPVLNWANVCSLNILRTLQRTMIRFLIELLVHRIWFGQSKFYFILNWLVMRCKLRPELAADAQQTA